MANITNYDNSNLKKGYCEKCGAFFTYNDNELYSESNGFFRLGRSYLYCPGCRTKIYHTYGSVKNEKTGEYHNYFEY